MHIHLCIHIRLSVYMHICMHVHMCIYIDRCVYVYVLMGTCMYVYVFNVYVYISIYIERERETATAWRGEFGNTRVGCTGLGWAWQYTRLSLCTCSLYIISYGLCMHFSAAPQALFSCCATSQVVPSWVLGHNLKPLVLSFLCLSWTPTNMAHAPYRCRNFWVLAHIG